MVRAEVAAPFVDDSSASEFFDADFSEADSFDVDSFDAESFEGVCFDPFESFELPSFESPSLGPASAPPFVPALSPSVSVSRAPFTCDSGFGVVEPLGLLAEPEPDGLEVSGDAEDPDEVDESDVLEVDEEPPASSAAAMATCGPTTASAAPNPADAAPNANQRRTAKFSDRVPARRTPPVPARFDSFSDDDTASPHSDQNHQLTPAKIAGHWEGN